MKPNVTVIVVSYNTRELTLACLRSVLRETRRTSIKVVVVDNASSDGSADAIADELPEITLIRSDENLGFAKANNLAAARTRGNFLLLLNPDTVVLDSAIDRLMDFAADHPAAGIWGGRTVFADGSLNPTSCWGFMSPWSLFSQSIGLARRWRHSSLFNPEGYGGWQRDTVRNVDIVTGCFLLITRELWDALDGFDERFFMYAEEADLCYRARKLGVRPAFTPRSHIIHHGGASEPVRSTKAVRLLQAKATFIRKHWHLGRPFGISFLRMHVLTRVLAYKCLAIVDRTNAGCYAARTAEWVSVWGSRKVWTAGFGEASR